MSTPSRPSLLTGSRLSRRRVLRGGATGVVSLAGLSLLAGCTGSAATPEAASPTPAAAAPASTAPAATATSVVPRPKYGGTYRHRATGEFPHLDPHQTNSPILFVQGPGWAYSRLVSPTSAPERKGNEVLYVGDLAEKWDIADDRTFIFKLRPGIKFHNIKPVNGRALTAEDVKFSLERQVAMKINAGGLPAFEKLEAVDPVTLKLTLKQPDADAIVSLAAITNVVIAREVLDSTASGDLKEGPTIGSGPFIHEKWDKDAVASLTRNPDYYLKGIPYVDRIEFPRINDDQSKFAAFRAKQLGWGPQSITVAQYNELKKQDPTLHLEKSRRNGGLIEIGLVVTKPPFNDKRLRQAINYAVDRQAVIDSIGEGLGYLSSATPMPTWDWFLPQDEMKQLQRRDLAKARQLLADAGYPNGQGLPEIEFYHPKFIDTWTAIAELNLAQLKEVGIQGKLKVVDVATYLSQVATGAAKDMIAYHGPTILPSASTNADLFTKHLPGGPRNAFGIDDPKLTDMIQKQAVMLRDPDGRKKALQDVQRYLIDSAHSVNIIGAEFITAWWDFVKNMRNIDQPTNDYEFIRYLWLDQ